jgi:hypothetical protein
MTILLVLDGVLGLSAAAMIVGILPGFHGRGDFFPNAAATYQGYVSISFQGVYHYVIASPICTGSTHCPNSENVFFLDAKNGTIRLIFYCDNNFCEDPSQLAFGDGTCLHVKGTLIEPSEWPSHEFSPFMNFAGDLYVFESNALDAASCS